MAEKTFVSFDMEIDNADHHWSALSNYFNQLMGEFGFEEHYRIADEIRKYADINEGTLNEFKNLTDNVIHPKVQAFAFIVADLIDQKWRFTTSENGLFLTRSEKTEELVRLQLQVRRNAALSHKPVQSFLDSMERTKPSSLRKSIKCIFHDGIDLAMQIEEVNAGKKSIHDVVRPSLQLVTSDLKDSSSGHYLTDIWRYFRLTWSLEHNSVPGRQMCFLIRNDAQPNRPVMAIGSLASPVLQHGLRDNWIGWTYEGVLNSYATGKLSYEEIIKLMKEGVNHAMSQLYINDFDLAVSQIENPSFADIHSLEGISESERMKRLNLLKSDSADDYRKKAQPAEMSEEEIKARSREPLFKSKRALRLAKLLNVKRFINKLDQLKNHFEATQLLFQSPEGRSAISFSVGEFRTVGAASRIADLNVCGAIPPYNHLIGGKLAALSVFSEELQKHYRARYKNAESEIASFMAGRRVVRSTNLEIVTTTSLFGDRLGQYHGLKLKKSKFEKLAGDCAWERLGLTTGEGSFQFSNKTNAVLKKLLAITKGYRNVNNVFGEGTSPKIRNLREALSLLGFNVHELLTHEQQRLFLIAELSPNAKTRLFNPHLKNATKRSSFKCISDAWIDKWVLNRIKKEHVMIKIKEENFERLSSSLRPQTYDTQYKLL